MTINFPSSPSNGDTYLYNGVTYVYNSTTDQWIVESTGSSELYVLKTGDTMTGSLTSAGYSGTTGTFSGDVSAVDGTLTGRLLVGPSSSSSLPIGFDSALQVEGTSAATSSISITRNSADDNPPYLTLGKSRGTTLGSNAGVTSNDTLGILSFSGSDGSGDFNVHADIRGYVDGVSGAGDSPGRLVFSTTSDGTSSPKERWRISAVGGLESTGANQESWNIVCSRPTGPNQGHIRFFNGNAEVGFIATSTTATTYSTSSDYRLKENVAPFTGGIARLQQLKPSRFNFIADPSAVVDGFIAHEVQNVVPEAVTGEKDAVDDEGNPDYQGIDQSKLVPLLTAALQEAITRIEALEAQLTQLAGGASS